MSGVTAHIRNAGNKSNSGINVGNSSYVMNSSCDKILLRFSGKSPMRIAVSTGHYAIEQS